MTVTLPGSMTLREWADRIAQDLDIFGVLSKLEDEVHWQDWAVQFLNIPALGGSLPNPYGFTNWREWAELFCGVIA